MLRKLTLSLVIASVIGLTQTPSAMADDKPFLAKLVSAIAYANDVMTYRTTNQQRIDAQKAEERRERQRNAPIGSLGIRG